MNRKLIALLIIILPLTAGIIAWKMTPRIEAVNPPADESLLGGQALQITFTRPMRAESVEERLDVHPPQAGTITWDDLHSTLTFTPEQAWTPGQTITLSLAYGAKSQRGLPIPQNHTWNFKISPTHLVYLWPADASSNLYTLNLESGESQTLTAYPTGVLDFDVSADGLRLYYSVWHSSEESAIYLLDRLTRESTPLIKCSPSLCRSPKISPTEQYLAYERIPQQANAAPSIYIYDLKNHQTTVVSEKAHFAENPLWSSDGTLAYYDRTQQAYIFNFLEDRGIAFPGGGVNLPNQIGGFGSFSPGGEFFAASEILQIETDTAPRQLLTFSLVTGLTRALTSTEYLEDVNPVYSPVGSYIAFERKCLRESCWTPGRQLWLMSSDGTNARPLTDSPDYNHTGVVWNPDGESLAYVRYNNAKISDPPEIWTISRTGSDNIRLVINGYSPRWLP